MRGKIIAVDLDGTLTNSMCFTAEEIVKAVPIENVCQKVRELYRENFIVIYTARREFLVEATLKWLRINDIPFHAISVNKIWYDFHLDDRSFSLEELNKKDI